MSKIKVETLSAEEADHGVVELWSDGTMFAFTVYDEGDLVLRISPSRDGGPVVVGVHSLAAALAEVDRVLAAG